MKRTHILASYDSSGDFQIIGEPGTYEEKAKELRDLRGSGSSKFDKAALISLKAGIRKRRPIPEPVKQSAKKKAATEE